MKPSASLQVQLAIGLILGLVSGYLFSSTPVLETPPAPTTATSTLPPQAFQNLPGAWMVQVRFFRTALPEIESVTALPEGRISVLTSGEYAARILDTHDQLLYTLPFQVQFLSGEPPSPVDEILLILVLPAPQGATTLQITTPNGEITYDFPN
jgi:hypothetical protein